MISEVMNKARLLRNNPARVFKKFNHTKMQRIISDELFLKLMVKARLGYRLNLNNPKTFNEKLQWIKLYDHNPIYTRMVDKYDAKEIIAAAVGSEYVVPTFGVWDRFEDICFTNLPEQFVLKTTHDCGGVYICHKQSEFDMVFVEKDIKRRLKDNFYWQGREWPYKNVRPRILAEKYLSSDSKGSQGSITDYKVMCFNGIAQYTLVCTGRNSKEGLCENFYDRLWRPAPFRRKSPLSPFSIARPKHYDRMIEIAELLSQGIAFLRVDFFEAEEQLYVGELTFFPANGFGAFLPNEWDDKLGSLILLPDLGDHK